MYFMFGRVKNGKSVVELVNVSDDVDIEEYVDDLRRRDPTTVGPVYAHTEMGVRNRFNDLVQAGKEIYLQENPSAVM